jgi:hypothetical protein
MNRSTLSSRGVFFSKKPVDKKQAEEDPEKRFPQTVNNRILASHKPDDQRHDRNCQKDISQIPHIVDLE